MNHKRYFACSLVIACFLTVGCATNDEIYGFKRGDKINLVQPYTKFFQLGENGGVRQNWLANLEAESQRLSKPKDKVVFQAFEQALNEGFSMSNPYDAKLMAQSINDLHQRNLISQDQFLKLRENYLEKVLARADDGMLFAYLEYDALAAEFPTIRSTSFTSRAANRLAERVRNNRQVQFTEVKSLLDVLYSQNQPIPEPLAKVMSHVFMSGVEASSPPVSKSNPLLAAEIFAANGGIFLNEKVQESNDSRVQNLLQIAIRNLKDPPSARFRKSFLINDSGQFSLCGEINAKNSLGGYVGFQPFVALENGTAVILDDKKSTQEQTLYETICFQRFVLERL